jgi:hypothetical protein
VIVGWLCREKSFTICATPQPTSEERGYQTYPISLYLTRTQALKLFLLYQWK